MNKSLRSLIRDQQGNVAILTSVAAIPLLLLGLGTINLYQTAGERADAQGILDAAALAALHPLDAKKPDSQKAIAVAQEVLRTHTDTLPDLLSARIVPDAKNGTIKITYESTNKSNINVVVWDGKVHYKVESMAKLEKKRMPVCVLIMEETDKHTLFALGNSKIHFDACIVQVDTVNWDAVEGRANGEIVSTNGQHCFNGEIHRGKVLPPRADINSCTFFPDPFAGKAVPAANLNCGGTAGLTVISTPGEVDTSHAYCGGLEIRANVTFKEGVIVVKDGPFKITGANTQVNAPKNTIALVGPKAILDFAAGTNAKLTISAPKDGDIGPLDGFAFFTDQAALGTPKNAPASAVSNIQIDMAGIMYLRGHELTVNGDAIVKASPGAIVSDYLITDDNAFVDLHALSVDAAGYDEMLKTLDEVATPVLVK